MQSRIRAEPVVGVGQVVRLAGWWAGPGAGSCRTGRINDWRVGQVNGK